MNFGATPEEWAHMDLVLGLGESLLPVVSNPNAKISPASAIKKIGQIPSLYNDQHLVSGMRQWTAKKSTPGDIANWSRQPDYGICIQCREIRAFDCDLPDPDLSAQVYSFLEQNLPVALPLRGRENSSKFLLAFRLKKSDLGKRIIKIDKDNKIELLATGQQFVAIGTHPSGIKYQWKDGLPSEIPELDEAAFEKIWEGLRAFGIEESGTGDDYRSRNAVGERYTGKDPLLAFLEQNSSVLGYGAEGQAYVSCPFKSGHSKEGDKTETVYFPAGSRGYQEGHWSCLHASCGGKTDADFNNAAGYVASFFEDLGELPVEVTKRDRFEVINADDFAARPPINWIIKGILPKTKLALAYGGSGDGKTFVILDMALAVARGIEWNGRRVKQGRCVYICAEGAGGFTSRLNAYARENQIKLTGIPLGVIPATPNFRASEDIKAVAEKVNAWGLTDLIVVDTLAQVTAGADENAGKDMSVALKHCELLHELTGALVLLVHHSGKDPDRGARGWSGLKAPLDAEFAISREGETRRLWVEKMKDGRDDFGWTFQLVSLAVGEDPDGDVIDSCFVRYLGDASAHRSVGEVKLGDNEKLVAKAFEDLGGVDVAINDLIAKTIENMPRDPEGRDNRRRNATRSIGTLGAKGYFAVTADSVKVIL